jgi:hypothetical protein
MAVPNRKGLNVITQDGCPVVNQVVIKKTIDSVGILEVKFEKMFNLLEESSKDIVKLSKRIEELEKVEDIEKRVDEIEKKLFDWVVVDKDNKL